MFSKNKKSNQLWAEPSETPTSDVLSLDNPSSTGSSSEPGLMVSQINPFSTPRVSLSKSLSTAPERGATYDMYFSAFKVGKIQCKADTLHKEQQKKKKSFHFFYFSSWMCKLTSKFPNSTEWKSIPCSIGKRNDAYDASSEKEHSQDIEIWLHEFAHNQKFKRLTSTDIRAQKCGRNISPKISTRTSWGYIE